MSFKTIQGKRVAQGQKHCFVVSRFNEFITDRLLQGALDAIVSHGGDLEDVTVVYIPGAFEFPSTVAKIIDSKKFDAITCLGCVIRGSTSHYDLVSGESAKIGSLSTEYRIPVIFGVITTENIEQAIERAGSKAGNKGFEACVSAIEMINLFREL
jgi:6,7-dimethyl-8-ribityllumazine synthase